MILIGSKPYKLELNNIIDKFDRLVRFNMSTPNNNNGTKESFYQIVNCHVYEYIIKFNLDEHIKKYKHLVDIEHIVLYYNKFKNNTNTIKYIPDNGTSLMRQLLNQLDSDIYIDKQLRCGYGIIVENIYNNIKSYLIGYSINKNTFDYDEKSYYIIQKMISSHCHNIKCEIEILHELHKKNLIDCTLCLLDNTYELPLLNCQTLKPCQEIINLLLNEYGICILQNYYDTNVVDNIVKEFDNIFEKNYNEIQILDKEECSKDERIFYCEKYSEYIKTYFSDNVLFDNISLNYTKKQFNKKTLINKLKYNQNETRSSGAGYHRDNHDCQFKTIMYLTDVNEKNGCFTFISNSSKKYIGYPKPRTENYNTRYYDETVEDLINTNNNCKKYEICGKKGTIILVDTTYIHRGKIIEEGIRKAITQYYF
jgi:hypothetical protein